ncbi:MAG TPA: carbonic anhydrase [Bryobacteraceae bacterium]|nr:carbonic anhydrase [Bryobacteraceae bacterium]
MQKLFHFDCPREHYQADACVIACYDFRFEAQVRKFLRRQGVEAYDQVKIPGSVKAIAKPDRDSDRDLVAGMVLTSIKLHGTRRLMLFAHNECGAYGGAPAETIIADLGAAAQYFTSLDPTLRVDPYFCDFDGVYAL